MYNLPAFIETRDDELRAIMLAASLPLLVSPSATGLLASHLPLSFDAPNRLIGHLAKANLHWKDYDKDAESLAVFTAADGYISPSHYATKAETGRVVPTWNYQAVHVTGLLEIIDTPIEKLSIVTKLTERFESARPKPWAVTDAPDDYIEAQLKGIVGIVLHISKIEGKAKLSQNRSMPDRLGVMNGIKNENLSLAAAMQNTLRSD